MKRIQILEPTLIAQIAAGEVIESPAAIVKELVENSLDAGATQVDVRLRGDGFEEIQVRDDGTGIHPADLELAITSFATSKITSLEDLIGAATMGFRGEALGSIASVSRLRIESRFVGESHGYAIATDEHGKTSEPAPIDRGTRVLVRDLFYNVPVRRDYYQNAAKIRKQLSETIIALATASPQVEFRYENDGEDPLLFPREKSLIARMQSIWGEAIATDVMPIYRDRQAMSLEGYISKFYFYRSHAQDVRLWVNRRPVHYRPLLMLLRNAYGELMPKGRFPFAALFLTLPETDVDVNVHPQKREIRFRDESAVLAFLREAFAKTIAESGGIAAHSMVRMTGNSVANVQRNFETRESGGVAADLTVPLFGHRSENAQIPGGQTPTAERSLIPLNLVMHSRIFNTFIVATNDDGLYLIDQHTAHERINYERFLYLLKNHGDITQNLAAPIPVGMPLTDRGHVLRYARRLQQMGFLLEDLGPAGIVLIAIPAYVKVGEEVDALHKAISIIERDDEAGSEALFDQLAKDLSCRHAIRKGETASLADFTELVEQLRSCEAPLRCPHGRPTVVRIDEREIFSYFKRQV